MLNTNVCIIFDPQNPIGFDSQNFIIFGPQNLIIFDPQNLIIPDFLNAHQSHEMFEYQWVKIGII